jgi:hypothetical protein
MNDLAEWLLECIGEDEVCRNCGREVEPDIDPTHPKDDDVGHVAAALPDDDPVAVEFWANICGLPEIDARILAECEAKRRIVAEHEQRADGGCYDCGTRWCRFQQFLAMPYADRPGYRREWRP